MRRAEESPPWLCCSFARLMLTDRRDATRVPPQSMSDLCAVAANAHPRSDFM